LIFNCLSDKLREKLLSELKSHKCELSKVLETLTNDEDAKRNVQELKPGSSGSNMAPIQRRTQKKNQKNSSNSPAPVAPSKLYCFGCGKSDHKHGDKKCKAFGHTCEHCHHKNHFESVCKKKKQGLPKHQSTVRVVGSSEKSECQIHCKLALRPISGQSRKSHKFEFLVDSGAQATSLHHSEYVKSLSHIPLQPTTDILTNWDGSTGKTKPFGTIHVQASFKSRSAVIKIFIVNDSCLQVLGLEEMSNLGIQINTATKSVSAVLPVSPDSSSLKSSVRTLPSADKLLSELTEKHPRLFSDSFGLISGVTHRIQLRPDGMEEAAKRALDKQFEEGIFVKTDKAEFIHSLHYVGKPDGDCR
ncbi:MAG: hypothetical protein GY799_31570, partial [Desulfobulbaceae bacterium]|nr:hypothetical protein [Desulfobulbaceae bacterium]